MLMYNLILGEDMVLTSIMGASYAKGLSKNSTWSDPDAVIPVMKVSNTCLHFSVLIHPIVSFR
jgi:hypothetical protein